MLSYQLGSLFLCCLQTHAYETESYLSGKSLMNQQVLNWALKTLSAELLPQNYSAEASPKYRKQLALSLFYRVNIF